VPEFQQHLYTYERRLYEAHGGAVKENHMHDQPNEKKLPEWEVEMQRQAKELEESGRMLPFGKIKAAMDAVMPEYKEALLALRAEEAATKSQKPATRKVSLRKVRSRGTNPPK